MSKWFITGFSLLSFVSHSFAQQTRESIKLDFFDKIPATSDGCYGHYTYDTTLLKKKKYIVVTDLQDLASISISGHRIQLTLVDNKWVSDSTQKAIYKGSGYTVILTTTTGQRIGVEGSLDKGILEIAKGANKQVFKIHGISGCQ